jgi:putative oxidoreductase
MKRSTIVEIISALFILLFVYTAVSKLMEGTKFEHTLSKSPLIGNFSGLIAIALPITELLVALLLIIPTQRLRGLYASAALMVLFTLYLSYMIAFTPKLPCSCGGVLKQMSWNEHLVFNIIFTGLAFTAIWLWKHPKGKGSQGRVKPLIAA